MKKLHNQLRDKLIDKRTPSEILLANKLIYHKINFTFQKVIHRPKSFYIADFYIPKYNLIIEIDGGYHNSTEQKEKDLLKDEFYKEKGYNVLRINNCDVDTFNTLLVKKYKGKKIIKKVTVKNAISLADKVRIKKYKAEQKNNERYFKRIT